MTSFASSQALPNHPVWTKIVPRCRPACAHQSAWHSVQTYIYSLLFCTYRSAQTHLLCKWSSAFQGDVETWPAYIETLVWEWSIFNLAVCSLCLQPGSLTFDQGYCAITIGIICFCLFHILSVVIRASMRFLMVPGLNSVTHIITLLSVVFTLGSIMTSIYLLWQHQSSGERLEYNVHLLQFTLVGWLVVSVSLTRSCF